MRYYAHNPMVRVIVFLILLLPLAPAHGSPVPWFTSADASVLHRAALLMAHHSPQSVARLLRRDHAVTSAAVGRDGKTLTLVLPDGVPAAILPRLSRRATLVPALRTLARSHAGTGAKAIVLEPFHAELALPDAEGPNEAAALRAAGFSVETLTDQQVTVQTMLSLSQYNLVYMLTHSGVNQYGEGLIATGEVANPDPAVKPYYQDKSVIVTGVAGSTTNYFGVVSEFFAWHSAQFPPDSMVFFDGCSLLHAPLLWNALQSHGVSTMVSWDADAMSPDEVAAGERFTAAFTSGSSVADSIAHLAAKGYGQSGVMGITAHVGYLGDGTLRVQDVLSPHPTPTPLPTLVPTVTPAVSPTPTPEPAIPSPTARTGSGPAWPRLPPLSGVHIPRH